MEYRSLQVVARLIALLALLPAAVLATELPPVESGPDRQARLAEAKNLQREGAAAQKAAKAQFAEEKDACLKKFRVFDCQNEAKQRYVAAMREGRRIENDGKEAERRVRREELAEQDARRQERAARQEAALPERKTTNQAQEEAAAAERSQRLAEKEVQAREGKRRKDADAARLREKKLRHERKVAEKMEKARRHEAQAER